jgi:hypothetical protein
MVIVFTICSINYLAQAKALGESLLKFNPSYKFTVGLMDRLGECDLIRESFPFEMIEVKDIGIDDFDEMCSRYQITELNTAVKPFYIDFFLKTYPSATSVIYLDPDIVVFAELQELEAALEEYNIVLTPHYFSPTNDQCYLTEMDILNAGMYNLGFIAVSNTSEVIKFLEWWKTRLRKYCKIAFSEGMFVDQLWINFVPLYFDKVLILKHLGYNVAYWNLHERILSDDGGVYRVNRVYPLVFYHFSGYSPREPEELSKYQTRFRLADRTDVKGVFDLYRETLLNNGYEEYSKMPCAYMSTKQDNTESKKRSIFKRLIMKVARIR